MAQKGGAVHLGGGKDAPNAAYFVLGQAVGVQNIKEAAAGLLLGQKGVKQDPPVPGDDTTLHILVNGAGAGLHPVG
ncbi:hypothetical protein SDC9_194527 [bioreactor metagenome]|uniref:Uncharacterized protein n=1 Tax=bioreactor metagenome TaxID=1076179 RepID=A0A645I6Q2_9ZZZZ